MNTPMDDTEDKPLDPAVERVRKKMMRLMGVSIGIMMAGLMAVVFAIVYKISTPDVPPVSRGEIPGQAAGDPVRLKVKLPDGSRIISHQIDGDRVTLLSEDRAGNQMILVYDLTEGRIVAEMAFDRE